MDEFEKLADKHTYWTGVWQGFWAAWLYTASLLLLPVIAYAANLDFREFVKTQWFSQASNHAGPTKESR